MVTDARRSNTRKSFGTADINDFKKCILSVYKEMKWNRVRSFGGETERKSMQRTKSYRTEPNKIKRNIFVIDD